MKFFLFLVRAFFNRPFEKIVYHVSGFYPRNKKLWVVGAQKKQFYCNPKHFFISTLTAKPEGVVCVWLSESGETVQKIRNLGFPAEKTSSIKGIYYRLRAGFYFYNCSIKDIGFSLSKKAVCVNLWHGIPLKKIESDQEKPSVKGKTISEKAMADWFLRIFDPRFCFRDSYVLSSSRYVTEKYFLSAFRKEAEFFVEVGYPRTDIFFKAADEMEQFVRLYEADLYSLIGEVKKFDKVFLYAPTWRDTEVDFIEMSGLDLQAVNDWLESVNSCMLVKLHPYTKIDLSDLKCGQFSNIKLVDQMVDLNPLLYYADVLITDYSSVYFDFLLMDRPIIYFSFDIEDYIEKCRDLYEPYESFTPGIKVTTCHELIQAMKTADDDGLSSERHELRKLIWGGYSGEASKSLTSWATNLNT